MRTCVLVALAESAVLLTGRGLAADRPLPAALPLAAAPSAPDATSAIDAAVAAGEPLVIERSRRHVRIEADGTSEVSWTSRIRILTEAGVRILGQRVYEFDASRERVVVRRIRVIKADGRNVDTAPDAVRTLTAPVAREAPVYSDAREVHVTVTDLRPGDLLEEDVVRLGRPRVGHHAELAYELPRRWIDLDHETIVDTPRTLDIRVRAAADVARSEEVQGDRRVVRLSWSHPRRTAGESNGFPNLPRPFDIVISTYRTWDEVAAEYQALAQGRAEPTPEIRAKAKAITKDLKDDRARAEALYAFVSREIRYVSLALGRGAIQPRPAGETLATAYGDCKDKQVLLAALLAAIGIRADAALVSSAHVLDPEVPALVQLDHAVSVVRLGSETIWLDPTTEVAPFGWIARALRGGHALVVTQKGEGRLASTPEGTPVPNELTVEFEGTVAQDGTLEGTTRFNVRGDFEVQLRNTIRGSRPSWFDSLRTELAKLQPPAELLEAHADSVDDVTKRLTTTTRVRIKRFVDPVAGGFVTPPIDGVLLLPAPDANGHPPPLAILAGPMHATARCRIALPAGFDARAPDPVSATFAFGDYRSEYRVDGPVLFAERILRLNVTRVPADRSADFASLRATADHDNRSGFGIEPQSSANALVRRAATILTKDPAGAAKLLEEAVAKDPRHRNAWNVLGASYLKLKRWDDAERAARRQLEIVPDHGRAWKTIAAALEEKGDDRGAEAAYRKELAISPNDSLATKYLGLLLARTGRPSEAIPLLERTVENQPKNSSVWLALGKARLGAGMPEPAVDALERAVQNSVAPGVWNKAAYALADANVRIERASQWAEAAVATQSARLRLVDPASAGQDSVNASDSLASMWDTLGWVRFRQGRLPDAERFVAAAELVDRSAEVSEHLGRILEAAGRGDEAMAAYARAVTSDGASDHAKAHLQSLAGPKRTAALISTGKKDDARARTVWSGPSRGQTVDTPVVLVLRDDGTIAEVRPAAGDALPPGADAPRGGRHRLVFPDRAAGLFVVRTRLRCEASTCTAALEE